MTFTKSTLDQAYLYDNLKVCDKLFRPTNKDFLPIASNDVRRIRRDVLETYLNITGQYQIITHELVEWFKNNTPLDFHTVEIFAGQGVLAKALNIDACDTKPLQYKNPITTPFWHLGIPKRYYGRDVKKKRAEAFIGKKRSKIAIACFPVMSWPSKYQRFKNATFAVDPHILMKKLTAYYIVTNTAFSKHQLFLQNSNHKYSLVKHTPRGLHSRYPNQQDNVIFEIRHTKRKLTTNGY